MLNETSTGPCHWVKSALKYQYKQRRNRERNKCGLIIFPRCPKSHTCSDTSTGLLPISLIDRGVSQTRGSEFNRGTLPCPKPWPCNGQHISLALFMAPHAGSWPARKDPELASGQ